MSADQQDDDIGTRFIADLDAYFAKLDAAIEREQARGASSGQLPEGSGSRPGVFPATGS